MFHLEKPDGMPSIPETLKVVRDYRKRSDEYPSTGDVSEFDLVLDFGVPAAARWAAKKKIRSASVFDHCWSKTMALILEDQEKMGIKLPKSHRFSDQQRQEWLEIIGELEKDESYTQSLFVFPPFITPDVFWQYWREQVGVAPLDFGGVLGGRPDWTRAEARNWLKIEEPGETILLQAGDTPVWDPVMSRLVGGFADLDLSGELRVNVLINLPGRFHGEVKDKEKHKHKVITDGQFKGKTFDDVFWSGPQF